MGWPRLSVRPPISGERLPVRLAVVNPGRAGGPVSWTRLFPFDVTREGLRAAGDRDATVFFLTSKHSQHRIAVDTVRRLRDRGVDVGCVDLIAKQAMCLQPTAPRDSGAFEGFCRPLVSPAGLPVS